MLATSTKPSAQAAIAVSDGNGAPRYADAITLSTYYVQDRARNGSSIKLGLYAAEQKRFGVRQIVIENAALAPQIEVEHTLHINVGAGRIDSVPWRNGFEDRTLHVNVVEIVPYAGRTSPKIDSLDSATCANLAKHLGPKFVQTVAAEPDVLELHRFRYSAEKRAIIIDACKDEAEAAAKVKKSQKGILEALSWAGVKGKAKARFLLSEINPRTIEAQPYTPLFAGALTFKTGDRFACRIAPEAAVAERPKAIIVAALRALAEKGGHSVATRDDIMQRAWLDFGMKGGATLAALDALVSGNAPVVTVISRLHLVGLTPLVDAERRIAAHAVAALKTPLSSKALAIIEETIANAAELLGRPGFVLDADQADALRNIFANRLSITTGPPGSGKTTVAALANIIARKLYPPDADGCSPIMGVALAGRAASMLRDAASLASVEFPASTIHRALGMEAEADELDTPRSRIKIEAGVLVIDEGSMISAPLLAHVLDKADAEHVVILGDVDQLPPIGPGAPFADVIGHGLAPVTRLAMNYRTGVAGIRTLVGAINDGDPEEVEQSVTGLWDLVDGAWRLEEPAGVAFYEEGFAARGARAGALWRELARAGVSPHEIAVITPKNVGDDGTAALNRDIRIALGFGDALGVGDMILVTANCYGAPTADGGKADIFNGERCIVMGHGADFFDAVFPGGPASAPTRLVRFLYDGAKPPEGTAFGYALTVHKAQGSQFAHVILITAAPGWAMSRAHLYTAASRAREGLAIIGDMRELTDCAARDAKPRQTLISATKGA